MQIKVCASKTMDGTVKFDKYFDTRNLRMSAQMRAEYGLEIGDCVHLKTISDGFMALNVTEALIPDLSMSSDTACVTTANYADLHVNKLSGDAELHRVLGLTLGCDPELFLVEENKDNLVAAYRLFRKFGEVGHDGLLLEFRPKYSTSEAEVTDNIKKLIERARRELNAMPGGDKIRMMSASYFNGLAAGFHLHYGLPRGLLGFSQGAKAATKLMTLAMDYYVGVPAIIPEGNQDYQRRTKPGMEYGKPGGMRLDSRTFEYRLPGGILLRHPILTKGILALGAIVVEDMTSRISTWTDMFSTLYKVRSFSDINSLYPRLPSVTDLFSIICSMDISIARAHLDGIVGDVRSMAGYAKRATSVEPFFKCLYEGTVFNKDIESNWEGVGNENRQGSLEFLQASE